MARFFILLMTVCCGLISWADTPFFVKNKGQWSGPVMAKADLPGGAIFLEETAITYHFIDQGVLSH